MEVVHRILGYLRVAQDKEYSFLVVVIYNSMVFVILTGAHAPFPEDC